jgi:hypothetical protein
MLHKYDKLLISVVKVAKMGFKSYFIYEGDKIVKLVLPDGKEYALPVNINYAQRVEVVNQLLDQWEKFFQENWDNRRVVVCLDILGNYLCRSPEFKDSNVLSVKNQKELENGSKRCVPFSSLPKSHQIMLGIIDLEDLEE